MRAALQARWGVPGESLPIRSSGLGFGSALPGAGMCQRYLPLSPQRIILGGGVMNQPQLFPLIRQEVQGLLNGYIQAPAILGQIDGYIVPPGLGSRVGVLGALALAEQATIDHSKHEQ